MKASRGFSRAWDRISIYLPVILMGVLALGTYWLARTTPGVSNAVNGQHEAKHEADYFLRNFSVKSFTPQGRLKSEIQGVEARHYPDTDTLEIEQPRFRSYNDVGAVTIATAKHAISNGDASQVQLMGDAVVTRDPPPAQKDQPQMEIRSDFLHLFANDEKVKTDKPVSIRRGKDTFQADNLDYDNLDRVLQMHGRVHGLLLPHVPAAKP
ncbi:LPS export ABC transporter periplasmic protein LptC [Ramlibacter ginsenosidimutans]